MVHYIRTLYQVDYLSLVLVWQSKLKLLLYLQVKRKRSYSYFFFCCYGSELLRNSPFFVNPTNYRQIPSLIEDLSFLQQIFLSSLKTCKDIESSFIPIRAYLKEMCNLFFRVTPKNNQLMLVVIFTVRCKAYFHCWEGICLSAFLMIVIKK